MTRFVVMAMLQAARAKRLGLEEGSSFSWGLNRSIFYAAAKRGFRGAAGVPREGEAPGEAPARRELESTYFLGDEMAYRDAKRPGLYFTIGGTTQTEEDFRRQIAERFGGEKNFRSAWTEALELVDRFPEDVLKSGHQFYATVYKPRRDALVAEWSERYGAGPADGPARPTGG